MQEVAEGASHLLFCAPPDEREHFLDDQVGTKGVDH